MTEHMAAMMETAERIATACRAANADMARARAWSGGDQVRVYIGVRGEYIEITSPTTARMCQDRMAWSHIIPDLCEAGGVTIERG